MKDKKVLLALILLIALVGFLIYLSLQKKSEDVSRDVKIDNLTTELQTLTNKVLEIQPVNGVDGKTPVKGVDYFDGSAGKDGKDGVGKDGRDGKDGAAGEKGDKGDPAPELDIDCVKNVLMKKYTNDDFWQPTNIKCEAQS